MKQRGPHGDRTHCPHGHPYAGDNLILMVVRDKYGQDTGKRKRQCRTCKRESRREQDHLKPSQAAE